MSTDVSLVYANASRTWDEIDRIVAAEYQGQKWFLETSDAKRRSLLVYVYVLLRRLMRSPAWIPPNITEINVAELVVTVRIPLCEPTDELLQAIKAELAEDVTEDEFKEMLLRLAGRVAQ